MKGAETTQIYRKNHCVRRSSQAQHNLLMLMKKGDLLEILGDFSDESAIMPMTVATS
jgi:hypothetical protein